MTPDEINAQRAAVVSEAHSWLGTPYHANARIKGPQGGTDCGLLLSEIFMATGAVPRFMIEKYNPQWHMHRNSEKYIEHILEHANEMPLPPDRLPLPGDIVVWKFGRTFSHGALVTQWPNIIHALARTKWVVPDDVSRAKYLTHIGENGSDFGKLRPMRVFSLKTWCT